LKTMAASSQYLSSQIYLTVVLKTFAFVAVLSLSVAAYQKSYERIITDLQTISSPLGVPTDFRYNETQTSYQRLISVPGCPK